MNLRELIEEDSRIKRYTQNIETTRELIVERFEDLKEEEKRLENSLELRNRCELEVISFFKSLNFRENMGYSININMGNENIGNGARTFTFEDTVFKVTFNQEKVGIDIPHVRINIFHIRTSNHYEVLFGLNNETKSKVTRKIKLMLDGKAIPENSLTYSIAECNNLEELRKLESEIIENTNHIKMGIKENSLEFAYKVPNIEGEFETFEKAFENIEF